MGYKLAMEEWREGLGVVFLKVTSSSNHEEMVLSQGSFRLMYHMYCIYYLIINHLHLILQSSIHPIGPTKNHHRLKERMVFESCEKSKTEWRGRGEAIIKWVPTPTPWPTMAGPNREIPPLDLGENYSEIGEVGPVIPLVRAPIPLSPSLLEMNSLPCEIQVFVDSFSLQENLNLYSQVFDECEFQSAELPWRFSRWRQCCAPST